MKQPKNVKAKIFQKNLKLFQLKNPRAAFLFVLENLAEKKAIPSISIDCEGLSSTTVVYGPGESYNSFKKWLHADPKRILILVDDDLSGILQFLETEMAGELLSDSQVHFYFFEGMKSKVAPDGTEIVEGREVLQEIAWGTFPDPLSIQISPAYEVTKKEAFEAFKKALLFEADDIHATLDEYVAWGAAYAKNFWPNLQFLPDSFYGTKLYGKFKGTPAIIAAAGPSLTKQIPLLKKAHNRALLFAGGSAMNALTHASLQPHFGGIIDPNPMQYTRLKECTNLSSPYFFRGRACHEALGLIQGKKLYLTGGDGYFMSEWFEKKLHIKGKVLGGGHNISNFMIEVAAKLGCNPIILVGFDLSYTDGAAYAKGVTNAPDSEATEPLVDWEDIHGNPIKTHWKWLHEALWITDFQKKHKRLKIVNATEGGIEMKDIKHKTLHEVLEQLPPETCNLTEKVAQEIEVAGPLSCTKEEIQRAILEMKKSLESVSKNLILLLQLLQKKKASIDDLEIALLLQEIRKEKAYQYVLEVFEQMRIKLEYYKRRFSLHPKMKPSYMVSFDRALLILRYNFLLQVAGINLELIKVHC